MEACELSFKYAMAGYKICDGDNNRLFITIGYYLLHKLLYFFLGLFRQRGITLDLGFSSFTVNAPEHIYCDSLTHVQYTLVDCPGHASLIKTIIGGRYNKLIKHFYQTVYRLSIFFVTLELLWRS